MAFIPNIQGPSYDGFVGEQELPTGDQPTAEGVPLRPFRGGRHFEFGQAGNLAPSWGPPRLDSGSDNLGDAVSSDGPHRAYGVSPGFIDLSACANVSTESHVA